MIKKWKKILVSYLNHKMEYDKSVRLLCLSKKYKNNLMEKLEGYKNALATINSEQKKEKITIVFVCQLPALWNGLKTIYESAKGNDDIETYIVAIPEKIIGESYDMSKEDYGYNDSYDFCKKNYGEVINGYDSEKKLFYDLRKLKPTYVFLQRPYDIYLPKEYHSYVIKEYAKICYIPYGYDLTIGDSRLCYGMDFICNVYAIFAENIYYKNVLSNIFEFLECVEFKKVFNLGYPRFDLYKTCNHINDKKYRKTVLWLPRWTTDSSAEATTFFLYKEIIIKYFKELSDVCLICRPHPLMLRNFVSYNLMTENEAQDFLDIFQKTPNFEYDLDGDYTVSFRKADVFISDFTSLLVEEILMQIPIIYTGKTKNFDKASLKFSKGFYRAKSEKELTNCLNMLLNDDDVLKEKRIEAREELELNCYSSGKKIVEALINDYWG